MSNRFLAYAQSLAEEIPAPRRRFAGELSLARPLAANQRALVILIENGGVDLDLGGLVDRIVSLVPGSDLITADMRRSLAEWLRDKIKSVTDTLLESADLALNRYASAAPQHYDSVSVLRNGTATYEELKAKLFELSKAGKMIDMMILTHGNDNLIALASDIDGAKIKAMRTEFGRALNLRSVYMMNCVGASLNEAWIAAGAKASCGSIRNNYLPEPTNHFFWENWKAGQNFETAATGAYRRTVALMNDAVKGFISNLPIPGSSLLADKVDFEKMEFVQDSAPVIQGQRSVAISSDDLAFGQSVASGMATTVVPIGLVKGLSTRRIGPGGQPMSLTRYRFQSPSPVTLDPGSYAFPHNPAAVVIAGVEIADAAQIGLGAAQMVQSGVQSASGEFDLTFDRVERLLSNEARQAMPGSQQPAKKFQFLLFKIGIDKWPFAEAEVLIEWDGNIYGEMGTAKIHRNLKTSTDWSKSSCRIKIWQVKRVPRPGTDPRTWPITCAFEGTYDPVGNGHWEFQGEFEYDAFGNLRWLAHEVVTRSAFDFAIMGKPEDYVQRGVGIDNPIPPIPEDQLKYLRSKLP